MPPDPATSDTFDVRHDGALVCPYPVADYPTPEDVIKDMATWAEEADILTPGVTARFEVWRGDVMVATARRDGQTDHFIPGPPFDRERGMPTDMVAAFVECFPGVLDSPGPDLETTGHD